jgi:hypothetical protein
MYNCRKNQLCSLPAANMPLQSKMTLDDKRKNLQTLLKVSTAERLQKCLLDNIPEASVTQVDALLALMQPLASAASTKLHCVRCHKSFFEHANNPKSCRIPHDGRADGERTETGDDAVTMTESCCDISYDMEDGPPTKYCIVAEHTIVPEDVVYYDEEEDDGEGNQLVVTCATKGCKKRKVTSAAGQGEGKKKRA